MKPRNWRTYYWYRPPSLRYAPMTHSELDRQVVAYKDWLIDVRGFSAQQAVAHIKAQRCEGDWYIEYIAGEESIFPECRA